MTSSARDTLALIGLEFYAKHGVYEAESQLGARFVVDVELRLALSGEDEIAKTIDYSAVYELVAQTITGSRYYLIEALAHALAYAILEAQTLAYEVLVRVHKPHAPLPGIVRDVYAEVVRGRGQEVG